MIKVDMRYDNEPYCLSRDPGFFQMANKGLLLVFAACINEQPL
jgi:hypothetical protein